MESAGLLRALRRRAAPAAAPWRPARASAASPARPRQLHTPGVLPTLRRALRAAREQAEDTYAQVRADFAPLASTTLVDFSASPADLGRFQVTSDAVLGGATAASLTHKAYAHFGAAVFAGAIDYAPPPDAPPGAGGRGGFAAFRTLPDERPRDLEAFAGLELRVKTDGRRYVVNVRAAEHSPEALWQIALFTPPGAWATVALPFDRLVLTRRGWLDPAATPLPRAGVAGLGVLLADGRNGPFRLELQWVRAVRDIREGDYPESEPGEALEARAAAIALAGERGAAAAAAAAVAAAPKAVADRARLLEYHAARRAAGRGAGVPGGGGGGGGGGAGGDGGGGGGGA